MSGEQRPRPTTAAAPTRTGEYAERGDYHRTPDPAWDYLPTYLAKLEYVRAYLSALPEGTRVLDAGCGEGVLVEEFAGRLAIEGADSNYASAHVRRASLLDLPFEPDRFERVLCLDVLEHFTYEEQPRAIAELGRVLTPSGELLVSVPNLAHLQSRIHFALTGRLVRTAAESKHPGDRPIAEYLRLFDRAGFALIEQRGVFPTVPIVTAWIRRRPAERRWMHRLLTKLLPVPGWAFLNLLRFTRKTSTAG